MKTAIIIPVYNRKEKTLGCLSQLNSEVVNPGWEQTIVLVDDGSTDGTCDMVCREFPETVILQGDGNLWWTGAINKGLEYAILEEFDAVLLLNDDLILANDFLVELYKVVEANPEALVSSLKLLERKKDSDCEIISAGFNLTGRLEQITNNRQGERYRPAMLEEEVIECDILTGASLYIPLKVVRSIGLPDFKKFPHNWGDLEYTWRANLHGFRCLVATRSHIYTEYNPSYHRFYFATSTRRDYLRNLFEHRKFSYGFRFIFNSSFMHRPMWKGIVLFVKGLGNLFLYISMKIFFPQPILVKYFAG